MERRKLGGIGLDVSLIGLATEHLEQTRETMEEVLRMAVDAGVNYVGLLYDDPDGVPDSWDNLAPALQACREKLILAHWGKGRGTAAIWTALSAACRPCCLAALVVSGLCHPLGY